DDRTDIARIYADLVAEAAADIGRDDADIVFRDTGDEGGNRPHRVRRLEGAPDRQLAVDLVHRRDAAAGLQRTGVGAVIVDHLLGHHVRRAEHLLGRVPVALFPGEDVVVVPARPVRALGLAR